MLTPALAGIRPMSVRRAGMLLAFVRSVRARCTTVAGTTSPTPPAGRERLLLAIAALLATVVPQVAAAQAGTPSVTAIAPSSGPTTGNTTVVINGTGFAVGSTVTFGDTPAASTSVSSATQIRAISPAGSGTVNIRVTTNGATSAATTANAFTYVAPPVAQSQDVAARFNAATTIVLGASNSPTRYDIVPGDIPRHGSLTGTAPNLQYVPNSGYNGTDRFSFTATNAGGTSAPATVLITVGAPTITINGSTPAGERGVAYPTTTLTATGGTAPYSIGLAPGSGPLPSGLSFRQTGQATAVIDGTPTQSGTFQITVRAIDSSSPGVTVTRNFDIVIVTPAPPPVAESQTVSAGFNAVTNIVLGASNSPTRYDIVPGDIPRHGSLTGTAPNLQYVPNSGYNGTDRFSFTATNNGGTSAPATVSITVVPPTITINGSTPAGDRGVAYPSTTITATGGTAPYSIGLAPGSGPLPTGLSFRQTDRNVAVIDGTPTQSGTFQITVRAIDSSNPGVTATRNFDIVIAGPTLSIAPGSLPAGTAGIAYSQSFSGSGGTGPYRFTLAEGPLPTGLTLAADGTLSGTPTQAGSFAIRVAATDSSPASSGGPYTTTNTVGRYTLTIARPTITVAPPTIPNPRAGTPYSQAFSASGGTGPYTYTVSSGALPAGLTLATSGVLSGTVTTGGDFSFEITATDANGFTGARLYSVTTAGASVTLAPTTLPNGAVGTAYSATVTASGGTAPYAYTVSAGALPAGVTLAASGTLSGTPTAGGNFTFTIRATDSSTGNGPFAGERQYSLTISAPTIAIAPAALPGGSVGTAYDATLSASGGTAPYSFALSAGTLPGGLTLATDGALSGTPTQAGSFTFSVRATDASTGSGPYAQTRSYTVAISAPTLVLAPATLPNATVGTAYTQAVTASGGTAPYSYAVTAGALPAGVTLATDGTLAGTPTAGGSFTVTITATDASTPANGGPYQARRAYTLTVTAATVTIAPATLPAGEADAPYSQSLSASGGTAPYRYAVTAGALPAGVTLAANGTLAGTPRQSGNFGFTVTATDSSTGTGPYAGTRAYTLAIAAAPPPPTPDPTPDPVSPTPTPTPALTLASATLPDATRGAAYSQALSATGGTAPYAYAAAGTLPPGLTLSADGILSGRATTAGSYGFTVTVTDATAVANGGPFAATRSFTLQVAAPVITVAPASVPAAAFGVAYAQTIAASGGTAPYSFAVSGGALPAGITLSAGGILSGTPTGSGTSGFTVTATDANGNAGAQAYTLAVASGTQTIVFADPGARRLSESPIALAAIASSGLPVTFTSSTTTICTVRDASATLLQPGTCTIEAAQAGSADYAAAPSVTRSFTVSAAQLVVAAAQPRIDGRVGEPLAPVAPVVAGGGIAPYSYALSGGALPAGLAFSTATGTLSGTPTGGQAATAYTVTVTDAGGQTAAARVTLAVAAPTLAITPASLPDARQDTAYSQQLTAAGGIAPYSFAVASGTLPNGLSLSATGLLSGTPTAGGSTGFAVRVTDGSTGTGPFGATQAYTLVVQAPLAPTIRTVPTVDVRGSSTIENARTDIVLTDFVSGNVTDVEIVSPPANGTLQLARSGTRVVATYTPRASFAGRDGFSFVAVGPGGRSAPQAVTLAVTGTAPVAAALTAAAMQGAPVTVDLTTAATGGPFTAATVVSVSPAAAVTAQVIEGGSAAARTYALVLTSSPSFSGTATVTYTLANAFGASRSATVTLAVAARPDPASDAAVNGLSSAQAQSTQRFARAQMDNFFRRNEQLHRGGAGTGGASMGTSLQLGFGNLGGSGQVSAPEQNLGEMKTNQARGVLDGARAARGGGTVAPARSLSAAPRRDDAGDVAGTGERQVGTAGIWSGGAITVGAWDRDRDRARMTITTGGLSAGIDVKLAPTLIVGVGGGYGADTTRIDRGRSRVRGDSWSVAGYGSWSPVNGLFVDGLAGAGGVAFDTTRRVAQTDAIARGDRDGRMVFGSLAAGLDRRGDRIDLSAYGRLDYLSARLGRYAETGAGLYDLAFGRRRLDSLTGILGGRIALAMPGWTPRLRGEWRHELQDAGTQLIDYADVDTLRYPSRADHWLRHAFSIDLGVDIDLGAGWGLTTEVGATAGSGAAAGTGRVGVRKNF